MDLTELTDEPEITVVIGGKAFHFSELPIDHLAKLQAWIKANVPDPIVTLRERLKGYPEQVAGQVVSDARRETPTWPPIMGTPEAAAALMGNPQGQVQTLWVGLLVHQPDTTLEDAGRVYHALKKMRDGKQAKRIYMTIFGTTSQDDEETPGPKGEPTQAVASNGKSFSAAEQRLRMRKWEIGRYTVNQLVNALTRDDPDDPHAGQMEIGSLAELDEMFG